MTGHQSSAQHTTRLLTTQEPLVASKTEDTDMKYLKLKDWLNSSLYSLVFSLLYFSFDSDEFLLIKFNQQVMESMNWSNALMW